MFEREERVRRRAYEIWEREGRPDGRHDEHWVRALAEIVDEDMAAGRLVTDALDTAAAPRPARRVRSKNPAGRAGAKPAWSPDDIKPAGTPRRGGRGIEP
ncbi:DUF2934 domain-containing protein [Arenibaculum pallidiluteum]|uniref:DUF2934 domain-containing protein n=1 Tax=Arenibaculum pallidiluteum TaxID=2812559 RepID=UPI001F23C45D|nr:DUF2934 domain-containing protein [Arenibaculum pallidiluteum]